MKKYFVKFLSPGTFVNEQSIVEISDWTISYILEFEGPKGVSETSIQTAIELSKNIKERYGARPYCFFFYIKEYYDDRDPVITEKSNYYFLGGTILTLEEIKSKNDPEDKTLIWNMKTNNFTRVIDTNQGWTVPMKTMMFSYKFKGFYIYGIYN